jgi:hypothetical protein
MNTGYLLRSCFVFLVAATSYGQRPTLWRDPGRVERLDLAGGPGGRGNAPRGPFTFIDRDDSGTSPKLTVRDSSGRTWTVKWGPEVKAEVFASRLAWAAGYYTEPSHYVRAGRIRGFGKLGRASKFVDKKGYFRDARFELADPPAGKFLRQYDWTWEKNPFAGTPELNGLKILVMLTSNWDNKDARNTGSNTGILERGAGANRKWVYLITDWGASMGKWGNFFVREKWDCEGFAGQTSDFVQGVDNGNVRFGFSGKHDGDFKGDIRAGDVRWLMRYLGRISDAQILASLKASGASPHEASCFGRSVRARINQLQQVARVRSPMRGS